MSAALGPEWKTRPIAVAFGLGPFRLVARTVPALSAELAGQRFAGDPRTFMAATGARALHLVGCPIEPGASRLAFPPGCIRYIADRGSRSYAEVAGTFEAHVARMSAKARTEARRRVRRFIAANANATICREFRWAEEVPEFHRLACAVSARTYQERVLGIGLDPSPGYRAELAAAAAEDRFRGWILFLKGAPVAFNYAVGTGAVLVGVKMGFDPEHAALAPGAVLLHLACERVWTDRFRRFDFGAGTYAYKTHYATGSYEAADLLYFRRDAAALVLVLALAALSTLRDAGRAALRVAGVTGRRRRGLDKLLRATRGRERP